MVLEVCDDQEHLWPLQPDDAEQRRRIIRRRRRGRQCRASTEAAPHRLSPNPASSPQAVVRRQSPAPETAPRRPPPAWRIDDHPLPGLTRYLPAGYSLDNSSSSDDVDFLTSAAESMEEFPDLAFVGHVRE